VKRATISDAPAMLNTNDRAMWVLGFNEAAERLVLTDEQIKAGIEAVRNSTFAFDYADGSTASERDAAHVAAFRSAVA
jgi:hypothetical protein